MTLACIIVGDNSAKRQCVLDDDHSTSWKRKTFCYSSIFLLIVSCTALNNQRYVLVMGFVISSLPCYVHVHGWNAVCQLCGKVLRSSPSVSFPVFPIFGTKLKRNSQLVIPRFVNFLFSSAQIHIFDLTHLYCIDKQPVKHKQPWKSGKWRHRCLH